MELPELYNSIINPIDDKEVIRKLIAAYANSSKGFGGFYDKLTKTEKKNVVNKITVKDSDEFHAMMFNKWKNSIVAMTKAEFRKLYIEGSYDKDLIKMREYLKTVPDVKTELEIQEFFSKKWQDKELENAIDKYRYTAFGEYTGWEHICSRYFTAKKDKYPDVLHRLYLDTESTDTHKMAILFVKKCDEHHIPYYFKFSEGGNRDDTIVIYSSNDNITKYVEILREIRKEHPELVSRFKNPPVLTGKIDGWIGYGSEPMRTPDGKNHSFNKIRANALLETIDKETKKWLIYNLDKKIGYNKNNVSIQQYLSIKCVEKLIEKNAYRYKSMEKFYKKDAQEKGTIFSDDILLNKYGYTYQDLFSNQFKTNAFNAINSRIRSILLNEYNNAGNYNEYVNISIGNGRTIDFNFASLQEVIEETSIQIANNYPDFIKGVQSEIKASAKSYGIDPDKYCFDMRVKDMIFRLKNKPKSKDVKQENSKNDVDDKNTLDSVDINTVLNLIEPNLLEKTIKLPNGMEMKARQYIQFNVFPLLPNTGFVIMNDGKALSTKRFIEDKVFGECQEKCNGDFAKYMALYTKQNMGVLTLNTGGNKYVIDPIEIVEYINPTLMAKKMKLPNGTMISAKQYIQEYFAPHIPSNGRITLNNGNEISVIQYIEEILMGKGQEKYNGDIAKILFNTTSNNKGSIICNYQLVNEEFSRLKNDIIAYNQNSNNLKYKQ